MHRAGARLALLVLSALALVLALSGTALAASPNLVISQVYGGGGNSGSTYRNDFVEILNRGATSASLAGHSVQYNSATGTGTWQVTTLPSITLAPGQYALVQQAQGAGGTTALPTPDATGTVAMSATAGKVALVSDTTALAGATPAATTIVDLVGFGTANFFEGAVAPAPSNTAAILRALGGCTDTDANNADFATGAPAPRTTASPLAVCSGGGDAAPAVAATVPANGANGIAAAASVTVTFSEPVTVSGAWQSIACTVSGAHPAAVTGGPAVYTLTPATPFTPGESCTVTISSALVADVDAVDPPDTMAANVTATFTVALPPVRIRAIQGTAHLSPLAGQTVSTEGIVTGVRSNGFYLQEPDATIDADPATSEGILVFTSSAPTVSVGQGVAVSGIVTEFRPGGASSTNLTTTELTSPVVTVLSIGNPLPAPVVVGAGGRVPPSTVIDDDATGSVETSGTFDATTDGIDFWESLEGMRVQLNNAVAVGPTNSFGELPVLGDSGSGASVRTARGGIVVRPGDFNPERVILDDVFQTMPVLDVADTLPGVTVGILDYSFGNFKLGVTALPAPVDGGLLPEVTAPAAAGELAMATFNVENLSPSDPSSKFQRLAQMLVTNLASPDLVALEEIQDNSGPTSNGVVAANTTLQLLVDAIVAAGGPAYEWRQIDPVDGQDGGQPGGNIRVAFLFRTDRGLSFVDRPGAGPLTANGVTGSGASTQLAFSPGRIDPANSAFSSSRKPLAGEFLFRGQRIFAIVNHWNSKGGDDPLFGRVQPPVRSSEVQRTQQAAVVRDFVLALQAADPQARVAVLGDLNDFEFSPALATLTAPTGLVDLIANLPQAERYAYVFDGNSQVLDHILVSASLAAQPHVYDVVHVNSEFADQASDHDPQVVRIAMPARLSLAVTGATTWPTGAPVPLSAQATRIDGSGSVAQGSVSWLLYGPDTFGPVPSLVVGPVSLSAGGAALSSVRLAPGLWQVVARLESSTAFTAEDSAPVLFTIDQPRAAGGGFVRAPGTGGDQRGRFEFALRAPKPGVVKGKELVYRYRSLGGTNYVVRTTSTTDLTVVDGTVRIASFFGPATVHTVSGSVETPVPGAYVAIVDVADAATPGVGTDTFAITVAGPGGIFHSISPQTLLSGEIGVAPR